MKKIYSHKINILLVICVSVLTMNGCTDFIEVGPPKTQLTRETVFQSDATANAAISGIYADMSSGIASGGINSVSFLTVLLSDEAMWKSGSGVNAQTWYENNLISTNPIISQIWGQSYSFIYRSNAILEGLENSSAISEPVRNQLRGEALFIRAFFHFYLTNFFGDMPYIKSTAYQPNSFVKRQSRSEIDQLMIDDLTTAIALLSDGYTFAKNERVRPNKWAAIALLSRTNLYAAKWSDAVVQASLVIENDELYNLLPNLDGVFLKNSREALWQILPVAGQTYTSEGNIYLRTPFYIAMQPTLVTTFDAGDQRKEKWIGSVVSGGETFYFPTKYKEYALASTGAEYSMVLRLAEQFLIRAEAHAQMGNLEQAISDLDAIRSRAGLTLISVTNPSISKEALLEEISTQRRLEFFFEWGHRWFDLIRTSTADVVMSSLKPTWEDHDKLIPLPESELLLNPNLKPQNPGY